MACTTLISEGPFPKASIMALNDINRCSHIIARAGCACCSAEVRAITRRVNADLSRRGFVAAATSSVAMLGLAGYVRAQEATPPTGAAILLTNLSLFNGVDLNLKPGVSVLIRGDKITEIFTGEATAPEGAEIIDCRSRTLIPGLIDAHWHTMLAATPLAVLMTADIGDIHFAAAAQARQTLMRGFTTVRDMGGPAFALKRAIDAGSVDGPRIYPSGAMISQTSGHADFRMIWELPGGTGTPTRSEVTGAAAIADGRDAVLRATREQLMQGASQIKINAGGGASSFYDPLDVTQYLPEEMEAAVLAAADWGTYVGAHVYTPTGIQRCLRAGVKSIEHGQLADEDSVMMMADTGAVWSLQPFAAATRPGGGANLAPDAKIREVFEGTDNAYAMAIKHAVPTGFGSDVLFDSSATALQGLLLSYLTRWYTPAQALKQATGDNGFILAMSGARNPYPAKLGVIEAGAYADMILVDGDPTSDLTLVENPDENFRIIMKGGKVFKNTL